MDYYKAMLESMYEGIYFVDINRKITFWNKGAELITGFSAEQVIGSHCHDNILNHVDEQGNQVCTNYCPLQLTIEDQQHREHELYLHHKQGHRVKIRTSVTPIIEQGVVVGAAEVFTDISNQQKWNKINEYTKEQLQLLALYDQLTHAPNRLHLENFLENQIKEYREFGIDFGVLFIDIDHFRDFNNTYGHDLGDRVLQMVAKTMMVNIEEKDIIGRWGGEEFIGFFSAINIEKLKKIGEQLRMLVESSILRENQEEHHVTISIGGTMITSDDTTETLLKRADDYMYQSKQNGRNRVTVL